MNAPILVVGEHSAKNVRLSAGSICFTIARCDLEAFGCVVLLTRRVSEVFRDAPRLRFGFMIPPNFSVPM